MRLIESIRTLCAAGILAAATAATAQTRQAGRPNLPTTQPTQQQRKEDLKKILLDRPEVPITRPLESDLAKSARPLLPQDGSFSENRLCRVQRDPASGWVLIVFLDATGQKPEPARWGMPNRMLEKIEQIAAANPDAMFRLSGENSVYDGRAFLLIQRATIVRELPPPPASQPAPAPASQPAPAAQTPQATSQPASAPATMPASGPAPQQLPTGPSPEELIQRLRRDVPGSPVLEGAAQAQPRRQEPSVAPTTDEPVIEALRGTFIVDRLVTVVPAGKGRWMIARFESDNTLREPPLKLLPCAMLRQAELDVASSYTGRTVRLRVSGLITHYKNQRFLLLRKAVIERPMDRF